MTVSSTTVKNSYSGNGSTTQFAYGYKIFADTDLIVIIRSAAGTETVKTLTTHYTVAGAGDASGGSITFTSGNTPASGETVVIIREVPQTQAIDYIANDPFPAESHEEGLDRATMTTQQVQEELNRSIKLSRTNTMTSTEFTVGATDRANKILAFDSAGEISVTQELGTYKGTDATVTTEAYNVRDIIKSTTSAQLNNVYICIADAVVGDSLTDTDHFELLVDAVSAATSQQQLPLLVLLPLHHPQQLVQTLLPQVLTLPQLLGTLLLPLLPLLLLLQLQLQKLPLPLMLLMIFT
jgi:hypothetical protein